MNRALQQPEVAVLLYPGCIFFEVALAMDTLASHFPVRCYTPDGALHSASNGMQIQAHGDYHALLNAQANAVLVPGGNPDSIIDQQLANPCLQAQAQRGAYLAGICAGVLVLANAGLTQGRRITHPYTPAQAPAALVTATERFWHGSHYQAADVVVDKPLISAQPWAYVAFTAALCRCLNVMDESAAERFIASHAQCRDKGRQSAA